MKPQVKTIVEEFRGFSVQLKPTNSAKVTWTQMNWKKIEKSVFKLQKHIYQASLSGDVKKVRQLQKLLSHSYNAKLLSVRRVTQDNSGKKTAGVDGKKLLNYRQRLELVNQLKFTNQVSPLRRVWIPKPGTSEQRGLGIPTIKDRAIQMLAKIVLEPEWEAKFEPNSYGFRPGRSCHDAINAIFKQISNAAEKWVLDADLAKCFDKIDHVKLLKKIRAYPALKRQIKAWLKAGVLDGKTFEETNEGTPQGGVISPLLANIALHGMEDFTLSYWKKNLRGYPKTDPNYQNPPKLIRYADDFVILHPEKRVIEALKTAIEMWTQNECGLTIKESKTKITTTSEGFNFLGNTFRQFKVGKYRAVHNKGRNLGHSPIIRPQKEKVKKHLKKISEVIDQFANAPQAALIKALNPIIRGWCNYYSPVSSKETFSRCEHQTWWKLKCWARKRGKGRVNKDKYWRKGWEFKTEDGLKLVKHSDITIKRHVKVQDTRTPYDGDWVYWGQRLSSSVDISTRKQTLLKRQKGKCTYCGLHFTATDITEVDHRTPKKEKGKDTYDNLDLLHKHCHDRKTATDLVRQMQPSTNNNGHNLEEPCDAKVSRTVLNGK